MIAIGYNHAMNDNFLANVDPSTGAVQVLSNFVFSSGSWILASFLTSGAVTYALSGTGDNVLYEFSTATGALSATVETLPFGALITAGSTLLGKIYSNDDELLDTINPVTGATAILVSVPLSITIPA